MLSEQNKKIIREKREKECFTICDRAIWWESLNLKQKAEVRRWRKAWLDATETGLVPVKPKWIK